MKQALITALQWAYVPVFVILAVALIVLFMFPEKFSKTTRRNP